MRSPILMSLFPMLARRWARRLHKAPLVEMGIGWVPSRERGAEAPCRECEAIWWEERYAD
jgi:hypothetical protein